MADIRERDLGEVELLNGSGEVIGTGRLSAVQLPSEDEPPRWEGVFTWLSPPGLAAELESAYRIRFPQGQEVTVSVLPRGLGDSQLSPGFEAQVDGEGTLPMPSH